MNSKFDIIFEQVMNLILESRRDSYVAQIKSKLPDENPDKLADLLMSFQNPKKEQCALKWIINGTLKLPEDQKVFEDAFTVIEKQRLNFQNKAFIGPKNVINRDDLKGNAANNGENAKDKSSERMKERAASLAFDPKTDPAFIKPPYDAGDRRAGVHDERGQ